MRQRSQPDVRIRQAAATERARKDLGRKVGLDDPELLQELHDLGFTPETVGLLPLVPIIQMAWAEGGVTKPERELILPGEEPRRRGGECRRSPSASGGILGLGRISAEERALLSSIAADLNARRS